MCIRDSSRIEERKLVRREVREAQRRKALAEEEAEDAAEMAVASQGQPNKSMMGRGFDDKSRTSSPYKGSIRKAMTEYGSGADTASQLTGVTGKSPTKGGLAAILAPVDFPSMAANFKEGKKGGGSAQQAKDLNKLNRGATGTSVKSVTGKSATGTMSRKSGGPGTMSRKSNKELSYEDMTLLELETKVDEAQKEIDDAIKDFL